MSDSLRLSDSEPTLDSTLVVDPSESVRLRRRVRRPRRGPWRGGAMAETCTESKHASATGRCSVPRADVRTCRCGAGSRRVGVGGYRGIGAMSRMH